jgi:hypothetical protein
LRHVAPGSLLSAIGVLSVAVRLRPAS